MSKAHGQFMFEYAYTHNVLHLTGQIMEFHVEDIGQQPDRLEMTEAVIAELTEGDEI